MIYFITAWMPRPLRALMIGPVRALAPLSQYRAWPHPQQTQSRVPKDHIASAAPTKAPPEAEYF